MLWFYAGVYVGPVRQAVEGLVPHPRILVLSGEAAIGHPLVRDINGVWVSRQERSLDPRVRAADARKDRLSMRRPMPS